MKKLAAVLLCLLPAISSAKGPSLTTAEDVKITILSDMVTAYNGPKPTRAEWGFAALVEIKENGVWKKLLFDTGNDPKIVIHNAKIMGVELCDIEHVVLSHNHGDHTMGLVELRKRCMLKNRKAFRYAHVGSKEFFWKRPLKDENGKVTGDDNVMVKEAPKYRALGGKFIYDDNGEPAGVPGFSSVLLTGTVPRLNDERTFPPKGIMVDPSTGKESLDTIPEDQAMIIRTAKGLVVLEGCAHAGINNALTYVTQLVPNMNIYALIGGLHLFAKTEGSSNDPSSLSWLAGKLAAFRIQYLLGAHCTAIEKLSYLRKALGMTDKTAAVSTVESRFELNSGFVLTDLNSSNAD